MPPADPLTAFDHAYAERPASLEREREEMARRLRAAADDPAAETRPPSPPMRGQRSTSRWPG